MWVHQLQVPVYSVKLRHESRESSYIWGRLLTGKWTRTDLVDARSVCQAKLQKR